MSSLQETICNHPDCFEPVVEDKFCKRHSKLYYYMNKIAKAIEDNPNITQRELRTFCEKTLPPAGAFAIGAELMNLPIDRKDRLAKMCEQIVRNIDKAPIPVSKIGVEFEEKKEMLEDEDEDEDDYLLSHLVRKWDTQKFDDPIMQQLFQRYVELIGQLRDALSTVRRMDEVSDNVMIANLKAEVKTIAEQLRNYMKRYYETHDIDCISRSQKALKEHQKAVITTLLQDTCKGLLVVHGVGTGKTLTAVTASQCFLDKYPDGRVNIVTPTSLQNNMKKEMAAYGIATNIVYDYTGEISSISVLDKRYRFYTYKTFALESEQGLVKCKKSLVIVDEAHNMRNPEGVMHNVIKECARQASKVLLLSATPVVNTPMDLISLLSMFNPLMDKYVGKFPIMQPYKIFEEMGCKTSFYDAPIGGGDYPEQRNFDYFIPMTPDFLEAYSLVETSTVNPFMDECKISMAKGADFSVFHKCEDLDAFLNGIRRASNMVMGEEGPKYKWIENKLREMDENSKYVIFSQFLDAGVKTIERILHRLKINYAIIQGDVSMEDRLKVVERFNADFYGRPQELKVLIITRAGGEGLDLKGVTDIILLEPSWNESAALQVIGRGVRYRSHAHLPPERQFVNVHRLILVKPSEVSLTDKIVRNREGMLTLRDGDEPVVLTREMLMEKLKGVRVSADLDVAVLSSEKEVAVQNFLQQVRQYSIEEIYCQ